MLDNNIKLILEDSDIKISNLYDHHSTVLFSLNKQKNVVLNSYRNSGKSTVGALWLFENSIRNSYSDNKIVTHNLQLSIYVLEMVKYFFEKFCHDNKIDFISKVGKSFIEFKNHSSISIYENNRKLNWHNILSNKDTDCCFIDEFSLFKDNSESNEVLNFIQSHSDLCQLLICSSPGNSLFDNLIELIRSKNDWTYLCIKS